MKINAIVLGLVLSILLAATSDNRNAATWYLRAFDSMEKRLTEDDLNYIGDYASSPTKLPEATAELRNIVMKMSSALEFARRGSREAYADFQLDYSQGFGLQLPHLMQMRLLIRLMRAEAIVRLADGDSARASESLSAAYRMSAHLRDDATLISSLVGTVSFEHTDAGVQYAIDHAALTPADAAVLLDSTLALDPRDPFGVVDSAAMEQEIVVDWLSRGFEEDGGAAFIEAVADWSDLGPALTERLDGMTADDFQAELAQYDAVMDRAVDAFGMDDPEAGLAALEEINAEIEAGEHGLVAEIMTWNHASVHGRLMKTREMLQERSRALAQLAMGEVAAAEKANAVTYYLRAIDLLHERDDVDRLRRFDAEPTQEIAPELTLLLEECQPIIEVVRQGAFKQRCDFAFVRFQAQPIVAQAYAPGLRDLFRLLQVDARRLLLEGETAAAVDRLQIACRLVAHAALDETLVTSMVADQGLRCTQAIVETLPPETRPELQTAFKRIGRADPFGYLAALKWQRKLLAGSVISVQDGDDDVRRTEIGMAVELWTADEVLALTACLEANVRADLRHSPKLPQVRLELLDDVLAQEALGAARQLAPLVVDRLRQPSLVTLVTDLKTNRDVTLPQVADAERRMREARTRLREAAALLRAKP